MDLFEGNGDEWHSERGLGEAVTQKIGPFIYRDGEGVTCDICNEYVYVAYTPALSDKLIAWAAANQHPLSKLQIKRLTLCKDDFHDVFIDAYIRMKLIGDSL